MKSRHKILSPLLIMNLTKNKTVKFKGYQGSFYRNIHERTDEPIFSIDDAIDKLFSAQPENDLESAMDEFYMAHLPEDVMFNEEHGRGQELNAMNLKKKREAQMNKKKMMTHQRLEGNKDLEIAQNKTDIKQIENAKGKSDLTLNYTNSRDAAHEIVKEQNIKNDENVNARNKYSTGKRHSSIVSSSKKIVGDSTHANPRKETMDKDQNSKDGTPKSIDQGERKRMSKR